ncbi:MAG: glycoside hydrolase family 2, partial [Bacteroidales bacterium]|nr:glycoside hydrolase family 2 [Candidatus Cryptobacteroides onthequi]
CSVHQPVDDRIPGLGLGFYGQWFNRHDTWAEEARAWTDYLSRNCYMLRQGVNVADIAWFYGEDKNLTGRFYDEAPPHLQGVNYDFVNGDIICNVLKPRGKSLRTASGMDYKILVIDPEIRYMSWPVLRSIWKMVRAGVVICGHKPEFCAGLNAPQKRFWRTVSRIWDSGRRNVVTSGNIYEAMCAAGLDCDIAVDGISAEAQDSVRFVHRRLAEGDIYWVANLSDSARDMQVSVPVRGKKPEIWHADSGTAEDVTFSTGESWTTVTLHMDANDSQFIVLTKDTDADMGTVQTRAEASETAVGGPWEVRFQEGRGAPQKALWTELKSYTESPVPGIRYFSGTATYSCRFTAEKKECMVLNLGNVCEMARVILNGNDLGLLWKAPYRTDVTEALIDGENLLEIRVTNSWMNRLIGDEQPGVTERITYTSKKFYSPDDALAPAGLLGPVRLIELK